MPNAALARSYGVAVPGGAPSGGGPSGFQPRMRK